jgi:hypothetical protein
VTSTSGEGHKAAQQTTNKDLLSGAHYRGGDSFYRFVHTVCGAGRDSTEDIAAAWSLLNAFNKVQFRGLGQQYVGTAAARAKLRDAFLVSTSISFQGFLQACQHNCASAAWGSHSIIDPNTLLVLN